MLDFDVCQHWQEVVARKFSEWKMLKEKLKLPETDEQNKSKIFECLPNGEINVKLHHLGFARPSERYVIKYDVEQRVPKTVQMIKRMDNPVFAAPLSSPLTDGRAKDYNGFFYIYDTNGNLSRIEMVLDHGRANEVKTIGISEILPEYGETAYNATSDIISESEIARRLTGMHVPKPIFSWEEQIIGRRMEIAMITNQAIKFCTRDNGGTPKNATDPTK